MKLCPKCKSSDIFFYTGGIFNSYMCKDCGYVGNLILEFKKLPRFKDGRINYSNSNRAPTINCFVKYKNKILLLKRSSKVKNYKEKWSSVAGYIDEDKTLKEKSLEEIKEELDIKENNVLSMKIGKPIKIYDKKIKKAWLIHPVLIELKDKPKIKLDFEHTEYRWIYPKEIRKFDILPFLEKSLKRVL
ncbi:MAG: NUDIX domain-containing protein [archaeon]